MPHWTDSHNHLQDPRLGDPAPVIDAMREAGVRRCAVNATREADWAAVAALADAHPDFIVPFFGIHPWHAHEASAAWRERLEDLLETHPRAGVGECGLDQWVVSPAMDVQMPVFLSQIDVARRFDRPLTVHCLKAWGPLMDAFQRAAPPRFLMHSFGGSIETARRLIPLGGYFSCSGYFLHDRKAAAIGVFRQLPHDRILLETDAPDMAPPEDLRTHPLPGNLNHPASLPAIGHRLATLLGTDSESLAGLTNNNTAAWLGPAIWQGTPCGHLRSESGTNLGVPEQVPRNSIRI